MFWNFEFNYKAALRDYIDMLQEKPEISCCWVFFFFCGLRELIH